MDSHKRSTQLERLEVVETGRRRRWSDDEKLRIVDRELSLSAARDIFDSKTPWHIAFVADDSGGARLVPEPISSSERAIRLCAGHPAAEVEPAVAATSTSGQMRIVVGMDRRVIVDAGVDAAALARVLQVLERR